jgi:hypothetical protein
MKGALDIAETAGRAAIAFKGLHHIPLGGRVEESKLIAFAEGGKANQLHKRGIEKYAGCAAMVDILKKLGL